MKSICVVTGSRAEYGLLRQLLVRIREDKELKLHLIVTGAHLSPLSGYTFSEIERDGFEIGDKIEMNMASDTSVGICKSMGLGLIGFGEAYHRVKPDILVLLGDRYEIFAAASAAVIHKIPIAHIHGGELSYGAYDDSLRHAITKMSVLHFTSTERYRQRVIQLGENPLWVHNVGALGVEAIKATPLLSKEELQKIFGLPAIRPWALITFHPATLETKSAKEQITPLFKALDSYKELFLIFTKSNADEGGTIINQSIDTYVEQNKERAKSYQSLGEYFYHSVLRFSSVVIGNSSSGILEAPTLKVPTVDIGERQKGRIKPDSVISCGDEEEEIICAIQKALQLKEQKVEFFNPYEKDNTSENILEIIKRALEEGISCKKRFFDISDGLL